MARDYRGASVQDTEPQVPHGRDKPLPVKKNCLTEVGFARVEAVHLGRKGEAGSIEEEPGGEGDSLRRKDSGGLTQVVLSLALHQVGEDRMGNDQRTGRILHRQRQSEPQAVAWRVAGGIDIVMKELKVRIDRREMFPAPLDHPPVNIDPYIAAGSWRLL